MENLAPNLNRPREIFIAAVKLDPEQWDAYLTEACGDDQALRDRVWNLLSAHKEAGSFLHPAMGGLSVTTDEAKSERPGNVIGPYKLLQLIGEGGMGTVWMAEQTQPVQRRVALKIIKAGMDSHHVLARFEAERQALALMDHPNIAKVLDAGATPEGRPYFVMELVKGQPITKYCDEHRLTPQQRLELFVAVCQAIQHAHQKGIIHRDIKPTNVLVAPYDGKPVVKVIDFGVAKATGSKLTDKTLFTEFGAVIGTLEYMSPEQAELNNQDIDTRSDIYSLGVLLYELLTGTTPLNRKRLKDAAFVEMLRLIREEETVRPSTRLSQSKESLPSVSAQRQMDPGKLTRLVRGELDWIVMKALEKDRSRRYETANGFALDVKRYLADEPVHACPPSAAYRLRKFARRNKAALVAAGLVLLCIALVAGVAGWAVRDRAAREDALDSEVNRALTEAESLTDQLKGPEALAAVERTEKLLKVAGRRELPARLQDLRKELAMAQRLEDIFVYDYPRPQEENDAYAKAFADYGIDVAGLSVQEAADYIRSRRIHQNLVLALDLWSLSRRRGQKQTPQDWKRLLEIAKAADQDAWRNQLRDALMAEDSDALQTLAVAANARQLRLQTPWLLANTLADFGAPDQALGLLRQAQRFSPGDLQTNSALGRLCLNARPPQYDDALRFYTAALALRPDSPFLLNQVGNCLLGKGSLDEALAAFDKAIELMPDLAAAWSNRGNVFYELHQYDKALANFSKAIELDPKLATAWNNRALTYNQLGQPANALIDASKAIDLDPKLVIAWNNRAAAHNRLRQYDKAIADCTKAIELDPKYAPAWKNRGSAYNQLRQYDKAIADLVRAIELDPKMAPAWDMRGRVYAGLKQWDKALADWSKAIELDPKAEDVWSSRGHAYVNLRQYVKALDDFSKAIELQPKKALYWSNRAATYNRLEQWDKAIADSTLAIELDPKSAMRWAQRAQAYAGLKQWDKALADNSKAIELDPKLSVVWNNRGDIYRSLGQLEDAFADFTKAIEVDRNNAKAWSNRGVARARMKQWDEAVADHSKALELQPDGPMFQNNLALSLATHPEPKKRNPRRAVELAEKAVKADAKQGTFQTTLGVARYRAGDSAGAVTALQEALKRFEGVSDFQIGIGRSLYFLAMAQHEAGQNPAARQTFERALEWGKTNKQALEKNAWAADEMRRFQAEAEEVLGINKAN